LVEGERSEVVNGVGNSHAAKQKVVDGSYTGLVVAYQLAAPYSHCHQQIVHIIVDCIVEDRNDKATFFSGVYGESQEEDQGNDKEHYYCQRSRYPLGQVQEELNPAHSQQPHLKH